MDPNATLAEIRSITGDWSQLYANYERLAELVTALDEWYSKGGFLAKAHQQRGPLSNPSPSTIAVYGDPTVQVVDTVQKGQ